MFQFNVMQEKKKPSAGENFSNAINGLVEGFSQYQSQQKENAALKNLGIDPNIRDPNMRRDLLGNQMRGEQEGQKSRLDDQRAQTIGEFFGPEAAEIYKSLPEGGKTQFAAHLLETMQRGENFGDKFKNEQESNNPIQEDQPIDGSALGEVSGNEKPMSLDKKLKKAISEQDANTTPKEREKRKGERFKVGFPLWQESQTKLKKAASDSMRFNILDDLNKSKKLPSNFDRLNVDKEGNLRFPFAASPEAERYVKTLNEFSEGAKDSYGSRVTNFDLIQYFKRFPNLLNSEEGRKQILQQMRIVNEINSVYYKNLQKVYQKAGGVRNIDPDLAQDLAEQMSAPMVEKLNNKFQDIGQFSSLPAASEFKGKKMRDKETGEVFQSNGNEWELAQ